MEVFFISALFKVCILNSSLYQPKNQPLSPLISRCVSSFSGSSKVIDLCFVGLNFSQLVSPLYGTFAIGLFLYQQPLELPGAGMGCSIIKLVC